VEEEELLQLHGEDGDAHVHMCCTDDGGCWNLMQPIHRTSCRIPENNTQCPQLPASLCNGQCEQMREAAALLHEWAGQAWACGADLSSVM